MNPYQQMYPPPPQAYISAPPMTSAPPMMYPYGIPQPPPQGVPVARYAQPFVPVMPGPPPMQNPNATIASAPTASKKIDSAETTTVYVGKIPPTVEDDFIRKLLEGCGEVALWRRVTDPSSGQLKGFAFCDFKSPEGVLRALRLLNGLAIDGSNLLLKVDDKNQKLLDAYTTKRNAEQHGILNPKPGQVYQQTPDALAKEKQEDEAILTNIKDLVERQHNSLANKRAGRDDSHHHGDDKASVVSREIKNFRERQAQKEKDGKRDDDDRDGRDRDVDRQKERDRLRLLRDREREKDARRKQRDEKEFKDREREWEHREKKKELDREEEKKNERREKEQRAQEIIEQENEDEEYSRKKIRASVARRRRQREKEDDEIDRSREKDEIEAKRREEEEKKRQEELKQQELARLAAEELKAQNEKKRMDELQQQRIRMQQQKREAEAPVVNSPPQQSDERSESLKLGFAKRPKNLLNTVAGFQAEADDEEQVVKKKRTFVPLYDDGRAKKEEAQSVIDRIPTTKEELFAVPVDWALIDKSKIADKKMRPWVSKKIVEYLGEEEKALIDFIMSKITAHTSPEEILTLLVPILDEDASIFVVKMWRMLVYEMYTAAKA